MELKPTLLLKTLLLALTIFIQACDYLQPRLAPEEGVVLARVGNVFLYEKDMENLFRGNYSPSDSVTLLNNYIDSWIRHQLSVRAAIRNLPSEVPEIEKKVQDYRESLYIHLYETELIRQKMDTTVSLHEIEEYYKNYTDNFTVRNDIARFKFIKLDEATPNIEQATEWLRVFDEESKRSLQEYCMQYALEYSLQEDFWLAVRNIKNIIPVTAADLEALSRRNIVEKVPDDHFVFLLSVQDYKAQGETAPMIYVKDNISKIILNRRKRSLINKTYNNLYQEALKEKLFERYDNIQR